MEHFTQTASNSTVESSEFSTRDGVDRNGPLVATNTDAFVSAVLVDDSGDIQFNNPFLEGVFMERDTNDEANAARLGPGNQFGRLLANFEANVYGVREHCLFEHLEEDMAAISSIPLVPLSRNLRDGANGRHPS